jgi:L-ascorbate metabolism protein UlaG (beta-lactamase superfamily)
MNGTENGLYLREDAYFEPLFNGWYAWPYLIPPVQAARHTVNTHMRLMKSFLNNHELHIAAIKQKGMAGGEFLNCSEEQIADIGALLHRTSEAHKDLVELCEAVTALDDLLRSHTSGETIDYLYPLIPGPLKGLVEIVMDLEHRASYRLIEPLIYLTPYYKLELQTLSFGLLSKVKERPFVLSTPRLPDANHLRVHAHFASDLVDEVFRARETSISSARVDELFSARATEGGLTYHDLFTSEPPKYVYRPVVDGMRLRYTGHAGFVIETRDLCVLIDPVIANRGADYADSIISYSDLPPKIDYICLTHNHQDHVNLETLLQLRYKTRQVIVPKNNGGTLADPSLRLMLKQLGFNVTEVDEFQEIPVLGGRIVSVPFLGEHGDLNVRSKTGWYLDLFRKRIYIGADSSNPDAALFQRLGAVFADVDILAIGMECVGAPYTWLYGALHSKLVSRAIKNSRRLNGSDAVQAFGMVQALRAKQVYIYALGIEPWYRYFMGLDYDQDARQLAEANTLIDCCRKLGVSAEMLFGKKTLEISLDRADALGNVA